MNTAEAAAATHRSWLYDSFTGITSCTCGKELPVSDIDRAEDMYEKFREHIAHEAVELYKEKLRGFVETLHARKYWPGASRPRAGCCDE